MALGTYSMPRPEIDIVAFSARANELLSVEVKSLLDSYGVWYEAVAGIDGNDYSNKRYKLFNDKTYRRIVTRFIRQEYLEQGLINKDTKINYALAAGKIHSRPDEDKINELFNKKKWKLFLPLQIKEKMKKLADKGWEDNVLTMAAKLMLK